ncbi:MAG: hypothetical protein CMN74_08700 [Sphingorhabdus sp.]|mgnify:FL=1|nr:hypothetical protein [Sphingorhabdus sp.]
MRTSARTVALARQLRRTMSLPEVLLWRELRQRPGGFRFRRQHPVGRYVLDFYCPKARLAIEVDGIAHDLGDRPAHDFLRDEWLKENGLTVLRIAARDVLKNLETVLTYIVTEAQARVPLHHPPMLDGPPPCSGQD